MVSGVTASGHYWIASYPKSGNTWVRVILHTLIGGGRRPDLSTLGRRSPNSAALSWIEDILDIPIEDLTSSEQTRLRVEAYRTLATQRTPTQWLKVHDRHDPSLFPEVTVAGTIYIVRDPRDVAPSWADHLNLSLDATITRMNDPEFTVSSTELDYRPQAPQHLGSWSGNVRSWLTGGARPLLLRYEDMLAEPLEAVSRLAAFVGIDATPEIVAATVAACDFVRLQEAEFADGFSERHAHQARFFRQGCAGAWRGSLTQGQADRLWQSHGETMVLLGYGRDGGVSPVVWRDSGLGA